MTEKNESEKPQLPFLNIDFLKSPAARTIRILSEYLEPADRLRRARIRDTIVFFGSARSASPDEAAQQLALVNEKIGRVETPTAELSEARKRAEAAVRLARYYNDAVELSRRLTEWSKSLTGNHDFIICSGGSGGMMEAANRGAALAGGKTIGLNILLPQEQEPNRYLDRVVTFRYFFVRKVMLVKYSYA
ncbi:MAG: LOG family protein, partial [Acidobacteria bacterium]|nr:LOG family protein [Acidobacteriota bacterium]